MQANTSPQGVLYLLRTNHMVRVIVLIGILFVGTYGGVGLLRVVLATESPLMVVSSGSMIPTLEVGDIIIVRGMDPVQITVGTIIVFHSPRNYEMPIVHRVVAVVNGGGLFFRTKGDNNPVPDNWAPQPGVPANNLIGVYVTKIPYIGLISLRLRGPVGISIIVLLVLVIILLEFVDMQRKKKQTSSI